MCKEHLCLPSPDLGLLMMLEVPDGGFALSSFLDMVTGILYTNDPNFSHLSWFQRCKEHLCSSSPHFGLWRILRFLTGVGNLDLALGMVTGL